MACEKKITEVSECHNKTKTDKYKKSSSVREAAPLKLCSSRRKPKRSEASSSSVSSSMLKVPILSGSLNEYWLYMCCGCVIAIWRLCLWHPQLFFPQRLGVDVDRPPPSWFNTHAQARLGTFETKMAARKNRGQWVVWGRLRTECYMGGSKTVNKATRTDKKRIRQKTYTWSRFQVLNRTLLSLLPYGLILCNLKQFSLS